MTVIHLGMLGSTSSLGQRNLISTAYSPQEERELKPGLIAAPTIVAMYPFPLTPTGWIEGMQHRRTHGHNV